VAFVPTLEKRTRIAISNVSQVEVEAAIEASASPRSAAVASSPLRSPRSPVSDELGQWASSPPAPDGLFGSAERPRRRSATPPPPPPGVLAAGYGALGQDDAVSPPLETALAPRRRSTSPVSHKPAPSIVFRERWAETEARLLGDGGGRRRLVPVIVKAEDDLRQEQFASQLVKAASESLAKAGVPVLLPTYDVVATGPDAGIIEALPDTVSLDALRRRDPDYSGLLDFFKRHFPGHRALATARANFVASLAPACVLSYLFQLKDRHNGNILLDASGRIAHIDYGYLLASSPGGNLGFEVAPFKLTREFLDVVGADRAKFRELCVKTFLALREDRHRLLLLAEMTVAGCDHLPCFDGRPRETLDALRRRFRPKLSERECRAFVHALIDESANSWRTSAYDEYQRCCVGIL